MFLFQFLLPFVTFFFFFLIYTFYSTGTFGQVLDCLDRETGETVAIKVVRSIKKYREAAMTEIDVLKLLKKYDRSGIRYVQFSSNYYHLSFGFEGNFMSVLRWIYSLQFCSNKELV